MKTENKKKISIILCITLSIMLIVTYFIVQPSFLRATIPTKEEQQQEISKLKNNVKEINFVDKTSGMSRNEKLKDNIYVIDNSNYLSEDEKLAIYDVNKNYIEQLDGNPQLVFMIVDKLPFNTDIDTYKVEKGRELGIGNKENSNGLFFVMSIKDRKYALATGYGIEHIITDSMESDIVTRHVKSSFENKKYGQGIIEISDNIKNILVSSEIGTNYNIIDNYLSDIEMKHFLNICIAIIIVLIIIISCVFLVVRIDIIYSEKIRLENNLKKLTDMMSEHPNFDPKFKDKLIMEYLEKNNNVDHISYSYFINRYHKEFLEKGKTFPYPIKNTYLKAYNLFKLDFSNLEQELKNYEEYVRNINNDMVNFYSNQYEKLKNEINTKDNLNVLKALNTTQENLFYETLFFYNINFINSIVKGVRSFEPTTNSNLVKIYNNYLDNIYYNEIEKYIDNCNYNYIKSIVSSELLSTTIKEKSIEEHKLYIDSVNNSLFKESVANDSKFRNKVMIKNLALYNTKEFIQFFIKVDMKKYYNYYLENSDSKYRELNTLLGKDYYEQYISNYTDGLFRGNTHIESFKSCVLNNYHFKAFEKDSLDVRKEKLKKIKSDYRERYTKEKNTGKSYDASGTLIFTDTSHSSSSSSSSSYGGGDFGGGGFSGGW